MDVTAGSDDPTGGTRGETDVVAGTTLAIDYGTTFTAAVLRRGDDRAPLEVDGRRQLPSTVVLVDGELLAGTAAAHLADAYPDRSERSPKRHLGLHRHLLLGASSVAVVDAVAAVLSQVWDEAIRQSNGSPPDDVVLTHPVRWNDARCNALVAAASAAGIGPVRLVSEPVAAAMHYAADGVDVGRYVAVYDLGGGTFDTAVLHRTDDGFALAGPPGGDDTFGGEDIDHLVVEHIRQRVAEEDPEVAAALTDANDPAWQQAAAQLRGTARAAKEALSRQTTYPIPLPPPVARELRLTRPELEQLIEDGIHRTVDQLAQTVADAGLAIDDLHAIYLTGGSARIPLVSRLIHERFGRVPDTFDDPKSAVALGATRARPGATVDADPTVVPGAAEAVTTATDDPSDAAPEPHDPVAPEPGLVEERPDRPDGDESADTDEGGAVDLDVGPPEPAVVHDAPIEDTPSEGPSDDAAAGDDDGADPTSELDDTPVPGSRSEVTAVDATGLGLLSTRAGESGGEPTEPAADAAREESGDPGRGESGRGRNRSAGRAVTLVACLVALMVLGGVAFALGGDGSEPDVIETQQASELETTSTTTEGTTSSSTSTSSTTDPELTPELRAFLDALAAGKGDPTSTTSVPDTVRTGSTATTRPSSLSTTVGSSPTTTRPGTTTTRPGTTTTRATTVAGPTADITGPTTVCVGDDSTYYGNPQNHASGTWRIYNLDQERWFTLSDNPVEIRFGAYQQPEELKLELTVRNSDGGSFTDSLRISVVNC